MTTPLPPNYVLLARTNSQMSHAACLDGGPWHGWLYTMSPLTKDWVRTRKLAPWEIMQAEDQRDYGIVQEASK